jgi:hypothetical protein
MGFAFERFKNVRLQKNKQTKKNKTSLSPDFPTHHHLHLQLTTNFSLLSAGAIQSLHTDLL